MDSQWRYGARRALREGVVVSTSVAAEQVRTFHALCRTISARKGFELPGSEALMLQLLQTSRADAAVEARLFIATFDDALAGGVFILRSGRHLHYLWGGVDRTHARARAGEALQWAVIEWGLAQGCILYDLEGIDPVNNPGTYQFKKKMGGTEIQLQAQLECALDWRGSLMLQALRVKRRLAGSLGLLSGQHGSRG
jgi:lipid II:glycine glycyltransferase (peptidoglycan interpeptide bridge formation enzyme)